MLKGQVDFATRIVDAHISFPLISSASPLSDIESLELACPTGDELLGSVRIAQTSTTEAGITLAKVAFELALNRIAYSYGAAIESARITSSQFEPVDPDPGQHLSAGTGYFHLTGHPAKLIRGISADSLKIQLEAHTTPAEDMNYGHFRSARLSVGPVEEFMHLYAILLGLLGDSQQNVDAFILSVQEFVQQTPSPRFAGIDETIYTRLRNEIAHKREGVSVDATKVEITAQLGAFREVVRQGIARHS